MTTPVSEPFNIYPASKAEIAAALAEALTHVDGHRIICDGINVQMTAEHLVAHLDRSGFVLTRNTLNKGVTRSLLQ